MYRNSRNFRISVVEYVLKIVLLLPAFKGWGRYCFNRCMSVHRQVPSHMFLPRSLVPFWGYPWPGTPTRSEQGEGIPQDGVPPTRLGWGRGTPWPGQAGGGV